MNLFQRLAGFLIGGDEALNALGGGSYRQTLSGTVGRAVIAGKWWAPGVAGMIDALLGENHCARQAAKEEGRG